MKKTLVDNLGDVNPIEHGGFFIWNIDGEYQIEALEPYEDNGVLCWNVYRFDLPKFRAWEHVNSGTFDILEIGCDSPEWFSKDMPLISRSVGLELSELVNMLISENVIERAIGYQYVYEYLGGINFDSNYETFRNDNNSDRMTVYGRYNNLKTV